MDDNTKAIVAGLAPILEKSVEEKVEAGMKTVQESAEKGAEKMEAIEKDVAELKTSTKKIADGDDAEAKEKLAKTAIVNIFKGVKTKAIQTEAQFKEHFDAVIKETFQNTGNTGTPATGEGAEFVFEQFERGVYSIFEQYPLLNELNTLQLAKGTSITLPTYDGGVEAYWIDEGANFTASKAGTGSIKTDIYKLGALVTFTDEMLEDDMTVDTLYSLVIREAGVKFANKLEDEILNGNQTTGKMKGILTTSSLQNVAASGTAVTSISDVEFANADAEIDEKYDINPNNKVAVMKKATKNSLMIKRDANGNLVFPTLRQTGEIMGYRVVTARSMPATTTGNVAVLLGNFKDFYRHVNRKGFTSEMGHISGDFQAGKKTVRIERRDGGQPIDKDAFATITLA